MLTDVGMRCGGTNIISGSHRLVRRWFTLHPPAAGTRSAQLRKSLQGHPYLHDLCAAGASAQRIARFHGRVEVVDDIPLQVVENTASAGDLIRMHTLLLHAVPAAHLGSQPRFLLSTGIQQPYWEGSRGCQARSTLTPPARSVRIRRGGTFCGTTSSEMS